MTNDHGTGKGVIRIQGVFPDLIVKDRGGADSRHAATLSLFRDVFTLYAPEFVGCRFDFFVCSFDNPESCNDLAKYVPHVLTYSVTDNCLPNIIAIPDFIFGGWPEIGIHDYTATTKAIAQAGQQPPQRDQIFWIGNAEMHETRRALLQIGAQHPDSMNFIGMQWHKDHAGGGQQPSVYVSLPDHAAYSMLLDIRGSGYSGRLKLLMHAGRPLFLVERPFKEFFFKHLRPFEHYMPVRTDLSDLAHRVEEVRGHPGLAQRLGQGAASFAAQYLTRAAAMVYLKDLLVGLGKAAHDQKH